VRTVRDFAERRYVEAQNIEIRIEQLERNKQMPRGYPKGTRPKYTYVPEFTNDMQNQIDAHIANMQYSILPSLEEHQKEYMQTHLKNLIETCLWIATIPENK
jgi:hypothetical protein